MTIVLSPQVTRHALPELVIVEFRLSGDERQALVPSVEAGDRPAFLRRPAGSPIQDPPWTIERFNGHAWVRVPSAGYADPYLLTRAQMEEMAAWLDRSIPGWETRTDCYGNPVVSIRDAAPQLERNRIDRSMAQAWLDGPGAEE